MIEDHLTQQLDVRVVECFSGGPTEEGYLFQAASKEIKRLRLEVEDLHDKMAVLANELGWCDSHLK